MKKTIKTKTELPRIAAIVRDWAKYKRTSLRKLSMRMGKSKNYLYDNMKGDDIRPSLLLILSEVLNANLFEHYTALLPDNLQTTEREKLLHKKIESLETELEKMKEELKKTEAERDKYWGALAGNR
jgi:transcriptional regulator with XRE-family HTH domain